jgi:hypothetical protein
MASTYSTSLRLELMATGDQSGTWGDTTNTNLGTLLEQAITGVLSVAQGDAELTLTSTDGASDQARNAVVNLTGAMTSAQNVIVPDANKLYLIKNSTTGGFAVTVKTASGTGVAVPPGSSRWVYADGTNVVNGLTGNQAANAFLAGYTTTATAAGTTTLTVASTQTQYFTGTTTQTITLPVTSTLVLGQEYEIVNNSTGSLTVNSSGANLVATVLAGNTVRVQVILTSGTSAASWNLIAATLNGPTLAALTAKTTLAGADKFVIADSAASDAAKSLTWANMVTASPYAFRNKLINPLGVINQRGYVSGAATSGANQYTLDRWRVVTSGQSLSWTESEGVRTMTAPAGGVEQIIDGNDFISGNYVLNWEGTATATVAGTARTKGEVFTLTGGTNATVRFTGGTFSKPQLEAGILPTTFEMRSAQEEWAACFWFYETIPIGSGIVLAVGQAYTAANVFWFLTFQPKRATTFSVSVPTTVRPLISNGSYSTGTPSHSANATGRARAAMATTVTSGLTAGDASTLYNETAGTVVIDAELT